MSANERKTQLFEWNPETKPYPSESSIMELFEEHVRSTPNRIAVEFGNEVLTYGLDLVWNGHAPQTTPLYCFLKGRAWFRDSIQTAGFSVH